MSGSRTADSARKIIQPDIGRWTKYENGHGTEDADPLEQFVYHSDYIDAPLLRDYDADVDGTSVRHYYTQDAGFNVTAVTDDSGTVLERYHYTAHGELRVLDADFSADADGISDLANELTFTGRRLDSESGLYHFRHRVFHAQLGRFINRDPLGYVDGMSLYRGYFLPDGVDPFGLTGPATAVNGGKFMEFGVAWNLLNWLGYVFFPLFSLWA